MLKKISVVLAFLAFASPSFAQVAMSRNGGGSGSSGSSTITNGVTATSGCVAGGVLRSISNLVECGAGLTFDGTDLTIPQGGKLRNAGGSNSYLSLSDAAGTGLYYSTNSLIIGGSPATLSGPAGAFRIGAGTSSYLTGDFRVGDTTAATAAFEVTNLTAAKSIAVFYDNTTPVLTVADGGQVQSQNGSNASPQYGFSAQTGTGMWFASAQGTLNFSNSGNWVLGFDSGSTSYGIMTRAAGGYGWSDSSTQGGNMSNFISRESSGVYQFGIDVNGAAINQTLKAHDGTGTDISGANLTIAAGRGTGSGAGGTLIFQTAPVGSTGTTAQTLATRMTIQKDGGVTLAAILFTNLPASADGTQFYCSDCAQTTPYVDTTCAASGTGAMAYRLNGAWKCFN